jgi:hypothetical protein
VADKYVDYQVDPRAPWDGDIFDREQHGKRLSSLLQSFSRPHVVSVKADWGTGKTVFLKRLAAQLELDGVPTIVIDAWKTDYLEDPMLAFIAELNARVKQHLRENPKAKRRQDIEKAASAMAKFGTKIVVPTVKVLTAAVPGVPEIVEAGAEGVRDIGAILLDIQENQRDAQKEFRHSLQSLRSSLTNSDPARPVSKSIVIVIDELDRCRPTYAVRALERIKHFFDVEGVMFVLATDKNNLPAAVRSVYGVDLVQAERYLRRFIDLEYSLPDPSSSEFSQALADHFGVSDVATRVPYDEWKNAYINVYEDPRTYDALVRSDMSAVDARECMEIFPRIAKGWELSLRDQAQAFNLLSVILLSRRKGDRIFPQMLTYLCCLRFHAPEAYFDLVGGRASLGAFLGVSSRRGEGPQHLSWINPQDQMGGDLLAFKALDEQEFGSIDARLYEGYTSNGNREFVAAFRRILSRTGRSASAYIPGFVRDVATLMKSFAPDEEVN